MVIQTQLAQFLETQFVVCDASKNYLTLLRDHILAAECDLFVELPSMVYTALGGQIEDALPLTAVWHLLRHAGRILDDFQDGEQPLNTPDARAKLNASTGYLFLIGRILATLESDPQTAAALRTRIYEEGLHVCGGQHDDLTILRPTLDQCWEIAGAKTGAFCRAACWSGARLATADEAVLESMSQFGYAIGMLNQIRDDLSDIWDAKRGDFVQKQAGSLAVGYARAILNSEEKEKFEQLHTLATHDLTAQQQLCDMIVERGAALYLAVHARQFHQQAEAQLKGLNLPPSSTVRLEALLNTLCFYDDI